MGPSGRHFKSAAFESGKWLSSFSRNPQKEFFGSANGDLPGLTIADCSETDKLLFVSCLSSKTWKVTATEHEKLLIG